MSDPTIRILLVEDDEDDFVITRGLLAEARESRFSLTWAQTYEEALQLMAKNTFDACLLDYRLGARNGLEFMEDAARRGLGRIPIIFLTGQGDYETDLMAMRAGASDYLVKREINPPLLERSIRYAIKAKQVEDELRRVQAGLEQRVSERTSDLAAANLALKREISERRQAEAAISRAKMEWERTFDAVSDLIMVIDPNFRISRLNKAMAARLGLSPREVIGRTCHECIHGTDTPPPYCPHHELLRSGSANSFELHLDRLGGDFIISMSPIRNAAGEVHSAVYVARDITLRKKMEEEFLRVQKLESIGILAGGIAHDFNNLLTAILGNIDLAQMYTGSNDAIQQRLCAAKVACDRARALTRQFITFSKGGSPDRKEMAIVETVRETARMILEGTSIQYGISAAENLWSVAADKSQISLAFNNLIANARDALPDGGKVRIFLENANVAKAAAGRDLQIEPGDYVKIVVQDTGAGIPAKYLTKIFDPYFSTKKKGNQKGMGLGLTTTLSIIKKHDGYVFVNSEEGRGTIIQVFLPAVRPVKVTCAPVQAAPSGPNVRILVMDDEKVVRDIAAEMLRRLDYKAEFTATGEEALHKFSQARQNGEPFAAVILDLTIPGGCGGREVMRQILEIDPHARGIVSSGYSDDPVITGYDKHGFSAALTKPYRMEELEQVLRKILDRRDKPMRLLQSP